MIDIKTKYHVISVDKTIAPNGMPGDNWYSYIIGDGNSRISGTKPGTLQNVTEHAEAVAEDINSRSGNYKSQYAPIRNQKKNKRK